MGGQSEEDQLSNVIKFKKRDTRSDAEKFEAALELQQRDPETQEILDKFFSGKLVIDAEKAVKWHGEIFADLYKD